MGATDVPDAVAFIGSELQVLRISFRLSWGLTSGQYLVIGKPERVPVHYRFEATHEGLY